MQRLLVVANRTAGSPELHQALLEQLALGSVAITLLVPATWSPDDPHGGRETAARTLTAALDRLRADGFDAEGSVGDADPLLAVAQIWDPERFDGVIVSTLPAAVSHWLKLDLPARVERLVRRHVIHIPASEAPSRASSS